MLQPSPRTRRALLQNLAGYFLLIMGLAMIPLMVCCLASDMPAVDVLLQLAIVGFIGSVVALGMLEAGHHR